MHVSYVHRYKLSLGVPIRFASTLGLSVLCFLLLFSVQSRSKVYAKERLHIQVIEAQKSKSHIHAKLKPIAKALKTSFKELNHFHLVNAMTLPLTKNKSKKINLPKGLKIFVSITKVLSKKIKLLLKIPRKKSKLKITAKRKELFFQAMKWKGKVYILALKTLD
jgi:hypothetical protein